MTATTRRVQWFWPVDAERIHCYPLDRVEKAVQDGAHVHNGHPAYRSLCGRWVKSNDDLTEEPPAPDSASVCRTCLRRAGGTPL